MVQRTAAALALRALAWRMAQRRIAAERRSWRAIFADHAVLQRDRPIDIWGRAQRRAKKSP